LDNIHAGEESGVLAAEREFFVRLVDGSAESINQLLADDFMLIDVLSGSLIAKPALLTALKSGQLKFEVIEPTDLRLRLYQGTAVVTGRTKMRWQFGESPFAVHSRYTHVYVQQQGRWRLAAAQGTQITDE
jgi:hypothetical protein